MIPYSIRFFWRCRSDFGDSGSAGTIRPPLRGRSFPPNVASHLRDTEVIAGRDLEVASAIPLGAGLLRDELSLPVVRMSVVAQSASGRIVPDVDRFVCKEHDMVDDA